jgi:hypothetical protein
VLGGRQACFAGEGADSGGTEAAGQRHPYFLFGPRGLRGQSSCGRVPDFWSRILSEVQRNNRWTTVHQSSPQLPHLQDRTDKPIQAEQSADRATIPELLESVNLSLRPSGPEPGAYLAGGLWVKDPSLGSMPRHPKLELPLHESLEPRDCCAFMLRCRVDIPHCHLYLGVAGESFSLGDRCLPSPS